MGALIARTGRLPVRFGLLLVVAGVLLGLALVAAPVSSQDASGVPGSPAASHGTPSSSMRFEAPTAGGAFGEPLVFRARLHAGAAPERVELLTRLPGETAWQVTIGTLEPAVPGTWRVSATRGGHIMPNSLFRYRFRAVSAAGDVAGPESVHRVVDERLAWRVHRGERVDLWWHEGDERFAERAASIAEEAITRASELLGVGAFGKVDFFVYSDARAFRQAMGPGTRENVGGQAHPAIRTLFGLIEPGQVGSDWVDELVSHELSHLVFDEAVRNPWSYPPRWLNEGLAVYLSRGHTAADRQQAESAARAGTIIPLDGLGGQFPTRPRRFSLAYAESVSAVDFLIRRHGEPALVALVASFAAGLGTEEAFLEATGERFRDFDDAWLASLGGSRPEPAGPLPAPPGPLPEAWRASPSPLLR